MTTSGTESLLADQIRDALGIPAREGFVYAIDALKALDAYEAENDRLVARCEACGMTLMADDSDCGNRGCTAERDIAVVGDWKRRALSAEAELRRQRTHRGSA